MVFRLLIVFSFFLFWLVESRFLAPNLSLDDCSIIINDANIAPDNKEEMLEGLRAAARAIDKANSNDFEALLQYSLYSFL